jgi:hypothetical protein
MGNEVYEQIQARKVKGRLRMLLHAQRVSGKGLDGLRDLKRRPHSHPLPNSAGNRFVDLENTRRTPLRGGPNQLVPAAALSRLRFTDHHSEALSSPSRGTDLQEKASPWPQAG